MKDLIDRDNRDYICSVVKEGGPSRESYGQLNNFFNYLGDLVRSGVGGRKEINGELWAFLVMQLL